MNASGRNANGGLLTHASPPLHSNPTLRPAPPAALPAAASLAAHGAAMLSSPPLADDRLEWTPEDLAACLGCRSQKITYHCRQLERRGRLHKTDGVWRFDYATARLLLKHIMDNGHRCKLPLDRGLKTRRSG